MPGFMMRRTQVTRIRSTFALVLASAVVFGACGGDDSSTDASVAVVDATINVIATELFEGPATA